MHNKIDKRNFPEKKPKQLLLDNYEGNSEFHFTSLWNIYLLKLGLFICFETYAIFFLSPIFSLQFPPVYWNLFSWISCLQHSYLIAKLFELLLLLQILFTYQLFCCRATKIIVRLMNNFPIELRNLVLECSNLLR